MDEYEAIVTSFDGTQIWYHNIGTKGRVLVLIDGVGCDGYIWPYLIEFLNCRYRIIHWNFRGHGKSGTPQNMKNLGIKECTQDMLAVFDHAGVKEKVVLFGHSMGVQVMFEFYHRYPDLIRALVSITGSYGKALDYIHNRPLFKHAFSFLYYLAQEYNLRLNTFWRKLISSEFAYWYACNFEINEKLIKREDFLPYFKHLSLMDPNVFARTLTSAAEHSAEAYLPQVKVPTLIIAGSADRFTPYWISQRMHKLIPKSKLVTLQGCSHTAPLELPTIVNSHIEKFLDQLE